ncbi:hypothetical protein CDL12_27197 [Handroanthus impetiginosus]|uniref:Response regulatory domain-containing protein n=1 Tax=Handroanthus impetiginosus TaxID=429701 RepID=A0A2G9G4S6_9LAMI|nr:hypothetical protein CDL12_27197 [Handroanthus impetiginosus]
MDLDSADDSTSHEEKQHFHVLAVDDSQIDRKLLEKLLTVSSYQVTCVDSGDKALEYLGLLDIEENEFERSPSSSSTTVSSPKLSQQEASKVNLIMTDYSMPGISGYDLLKRIKDSSWKDIPVVVMSSENVPSRINMCLEGGAEEFLLKPVKLSDLRKLHSHLLLQNSNINYHCQDDNTDDNADKNTDNNININKLDDKEINENNCSSNNNNNGSNKRKANLTTSSDLDRRPRVQELPVS